MRQLNGKGVGNPGRFIARLLLGGHFSDHDRFGSEASERLITALDIYGKCLPFALSTVIGIHTYPVNIGVSRIEFFEQVCLVIECVWNPHPGDIGCADGGEDIMDMSPHFYK